MGNKKIWGKSGQSGPSNFRHIYLLALNANSSKTAEGTNFKFGRRVPRVGPYMNPNKYFRKVGVVTVT